MNSKHLFVILLWMMVLVPVVTAQDPLLLPLDAIDHPFEVDTIGTTSSSDAATLIVGPRSTSADGITTPQGVVELIPTYTRVLPDNTCSRWDIYSLEQKSSSVLCHGTANCCEQLQLQPARTAWDAPLYLTLGMHGTTTHNIVAHQIVTLTNNTLQYSNWVQQEAVFQHSPHSTLANQKISLHKVSASATAPQVFVQASSSDQSVIEQAPIEVVYADEVLSKDLEKKGIQVQELVQVRGVSEVIDPAQYTGEVRFISPEKFNTVIYCPNDQASSCETLALCGNAQSSCYKQEGQDVIAYLPHYSTVLLAINNETIELNITPDNNSILSSGENISLRISSNQTVLINYSLNGQSPIILGNGTEFDELLVGSLTHGTLANQAHTIHMGIVSLGSYISTDHVLVISDSTPPVSSINLTNGSGVVATQHTIQITSSEYASIEHSLNGASFSTPVEMGVDKQHLISALFVEGSNSLRVRLTDVHGNQAEHFYEFIASASATCSDATQNGDETGIDCGGSCAACISLAVSTDKSTYNETETPLISVTSRANSSVQVIVKRSGVVAWQHTFIPTFVGAPISETRSITNVSTPGVYTVESQMTYLSITENAFSSFTVTALPKLTATINVNATRVDEGAPIQFLAYADHAQGTPFFEWDFNNDGVVDSTLSNVTRIMSPNGTKTINLTVSDAQGHTSVQQRITVDKVYNVTIRVYDNQTKQYIPNASLLADSKTYTKTYNEIVLRLKEDTYSIEGSHVNYSSQRQNVLVDHNLVVWVNLTAKDKEAPQVEVESPTGNSTVKSNGTVDFYFSVTDNTQVSCTLFTRSEGVLWTLVQTSTFDADGSRYVMTEEGFAPGSHEWRLECTDTAGNTNATPAYLFTQMADDSIAASHTDQIDFIDTLSATLDQTLGTVDDYGGREREVSQAIELKKTVQRAITDLKRAKRDYNSLVWRKLNETELPREEAIIDGRVQHTLSSTPVSVSVLDHTEFVLYPSIEQVEQGIREQVNTTNLQFSDKQISLLAQEIHAQQELLTITTRAYTVEFTYLDDSVQTKTLVEKSVDSQVAITSDYHYFEVIPKQFASHVNQTTIFGDHKVINPDPVLEFELKESFSYAYILPGEENLEDIKSIISVIVPKELSKPETSLITGFAIFDSVTSGVVDGVDTRLLIEIIVIIILVLIYLFYSIGSLENLKHLFSPTQVKKMYGLIHQVDRSLVSRDYDSAKSTYQELLNQYKSLVPKYKPKIKPAITAITNSLNLLYIHILLDQADTVATSSDKQSMKDLYAKIQSLYKIIPKDQKKEVSQKCLLLHQAIASTK